MLSCISVLFQGSKKHKGRSHQPQTYYIEFHSQAPSEYWISKLQRVSILPNPENFDLVSSRVVKGLGYEIQPCGGTVRIDGKIIAIKGYADIEWSLEQSEGLQSTPETRKTRFYVPNLSKPAFDATFSKQTAREHGLLQSRSEEKGRYSTILVSTMRSVG